MKDFIIVIGGISFLFCLGFVVPYLLMGRSKPEVFSEKQIYRNFGNKIYYFKDNRTNLCFVGRDLISNNGIMTNVPCTPEVESLIVK